MVHIQSALLDSVALPRTMWIPASHPKQQPWDKNRPKEQEQPVECMWVTQAKQILQTGMQGAPFEQLRKDQICQV